MKKRRAMWGTALVLLVLAVALLMLCLVGFLYTRRLEQARTQYASPTVYITEPQSGATALAGSRTLVLATAMGTTPITRVELWSGGQLVEAQDSETAEGASPLGAAFELVVAEGTNTLLARAVNAAGMTGQSLPVSVVGEPLTAGDTVAKITVEEGQTLEDIASVYGVEPQTLYDLNPDLHGQQPSPGVTVTVPEPETEEDDQQQAGPSPAGPAVPAAPPGGTPPTMPSTPPLKPIQPSPSITGTVPLPVIVGSVIPKLAVVVLPPAAPTNLQGYVDKCKVYLRWNDNANNETSYDLWMAPPVGSPQRLASLQPAAGGAVWVEFAAPQPGSLSFWVEAVNSVGKQPSNIVSLQIPLDCPSALPPQLRVEVKDMTVRGGYDRAYCYLSFENTPEVRIPGDDSAFVRVEGEQGNLSDAPASGRIFVLPVPSDRSLDVAGECWGWSGEQLEVLGLCSRSYARDTWDGTRQPLSSAEYEIGVTIQLLAGSGTVVTYGYEDPTIPAPFNLREEKLGTEPSKSQTLKTWEQWFVNRRLRWDWTGLEAITGFTIFLDGKPYKSVSGGSVREALVTLPTAYDRRIRWQVAADVGSKQSPLSKELAYDLPKSQAYLMVKLDKIYWGYTCDGCCCGGCSECEAYGWFALRLGEGDWSPIKSCPDKYWPYEVECGNWYNFSDVCQKAIPWPAPIHDTIVLPFNKAATNLNFELWVLLYDDDGRFSQSDKIADYHLKHTFSSLQQAQSALGCGKQFQEQNSAEDGSSSMYYTLTVLPNSCSQAPPYGPSDWGFYY
jgi:hypothetical protein